MPPSGMRVWLASGTPPPGHDPPKLYPQENIWQFMRDNWLSNRIFLDADDLIVHCFDAWNKLEAQPWRIMSIGLRDWAHGF